MMRDFASSGSIAVTMHRLSLVVALAGLSACNLPNFESWGSSATDTGSSGGVEPSSGAEPTTEAATTADSLADTTSDASGTTSGGTTSAGDTGEGPIGDAEKPKIVSVELPPTVDAAGPVALAVQTEHTGSVHIFVDDVDAGELITAGEGLFTGELTVRGAIDNGTHTVHIIAKQGEYEDTKSPTYKVSAPAPGSEAWTVEGAAGSRTNRVAVAPARHLIEVGQTEIAGIPRPTMRFRSSLSGAQLGPEKILDAREGAAVDVAVLEDGRIWVAMNVLVSKGDPRARIALLNADGTPTGLEVTGSVGRVVRAIAADPEGGCFAVGVAGVLGNWDVARWRIDAAGVQKFNDSYDYVPQDKQPHTMMDLATDVVVSGDIAYVVGVSTGKHKDQYVRMAGMIVPMDRQTGEVIAPAIIAPLTPGWTESAFFGATAHPDGVLVTGYESDASDSMYRIVTSIYTIDGARKWHRTEKPTNELAYGSDVALDSQGRAIVAGVVTQSGKKNGYVFARMTDPNGTWVFERWFTGAPLGGARDRPGRVRSYLRRRLLHDQRLRARASHIVQRLDRRTRFIAGQTPRMLLRSCRSPPRRMARSSARSCLRTRGWETC